MSFLSHNSSSHSHLSKKLHRKNSTLHSVTSGEHSVAKDPQRTSEFAPLHYDKSQPVPQSTSNSSIFKL